MGAFDFLTNIFSRPTVVADKVKENTKPTTPASQQTINTISNPIGGFDTNIFSGMNLKPLTPVAQEIKTEADNEKQKTIFQQLYDAGEKLYDEIPSILSPIKSSQKGAEFLGGLGEQISGLAKKGMSSISSDVENIIQNTDKSIIEKGIDITSLPLKYKNDIIGNVVGTVKTIPEGISTFAKGINLARQSKNFSADISEKLLGTDQFSTEFMDAISGNEPINLNNVKTKLLSSGVPQRIVDNVTQEKLDETIKYAQEKQQTLQTKQEKFGAESIKSSLSTDLSSAFAGITTVGKDQSLLLANASTIYDPTKKNIDEVKRQALLFGVDKNIVDKITEDNIGKIKDNTKIRMETNSIEGMGTDGGFTYNDGDYIVTYDKDNNIISSTKTNKLTKPIESLVKNNGLTSLTKTYVSQEILKKVKESNPTATPTEQEAIALDMSSAVWKELMETANHLVGSRRLIDKELAAGEFDLAKKTTEHLNESVQIYNNRANNVIELAKIKIENKLVGIDLENYIEDNKNMNINNFLKKDANGKIIDTNGLPIPDYIISRQIDLDNEHYTKSSTQNVGQGIYHILTNDYNKLAGDELKKIPIFFQNGTVKAQVESIGAADPIPGYQYGENGRRAKILAAGMSDEAFALFAPDIILSVISGGATAADLLTKISKGEKIADIAKGLSKTGKISQFINTAIKGEFNLLNKSGEINKAGAVRSLFTNMALNVFRDINGEAWGQRVDPERGNDWNTNFAIATFMLPYSWQGSTLLKDLKIGSNGMGNIDMMKVFSEKLTNNDMKLDWGTLRQFRQADKKIFDGFIQEYNKLSEAGKIKAKKQLAAGFIGKETLDKGLKELGISEDEFKNLDDMGKKDIYKSISESKISQEEIYKNAKIYFAGLDISADEYARFFTNQAVVDYAGIAMTKPEVLFIAAGKGMKREADAMELKEKALQLAKMAENKDINILDMIKFSYDLPGNITYGALRSTIEDTPEMIKKFDSVISKTADLGIVDPMLRYVGNGDKQIQAVIQTVFNKKFLPSKQFSAKEMIDAETKAKGTILEPLMTKEAGDYNPLYWNKEGGNYKLNDVGLSAIGANMQPNKSTITEMADEGNYKGMSKMAKTYLDAGGNIVVTEKFIETVQKLLSDKLC